MKKILLDKEEQSIENEIEQYKLISVTKKNKLEKLLDKGRKNRAVSIRINEFDLKQLKLKALKNGIPYQTMLNMVIHKFVTDAYLDKDEIDKYIRVKKRAA